ncbi:MAG: FAD-binding oxidoreductase, partial [Pseudomonadota bacterium]
MKHSESWYAAALPADLHRLRPSLSTNTSCDVCIIGAGLTGVCAAYHLSGHGKDVVVLDAKRVGWGASGRNGGQIHSGFRQDLKWFHDKLGPDRAADIHQVSRAALLHLDGLIADLNIPCDRRHGLITAFVGPADEEEELSALEFAAREFGEPEAAALSKAELEAALGTDRYHSGIREAQGGHLQPLTFVTSVAEAAEVLGARFYDGTEATALETQTGSALVRAGSVAVTAQHVLLCGNGYLNGIHRDYDSHILPINNFILATEPIGAGDTDGLLPGGEAVADNRFVVR